MANHKLWGGRFEASLEGWVEEFGASIGFDYRLAPYDLQGSLAHVKMLGQTGIIAPEEAAAIQTQAWKSCWHVMSLENLSLMCVMKIFI